MLAPYEFIFDLDGTLVDSFQQITDCANASRVEAGFSPLDHAIAERLIGLPASALFSDLQLSEGEVSELVVKFRTRLKARIDVSNSIFPGVGEFLDRALEFGVRTSIATSKPQTLADSVVAKSALQGRIHHIQGTDGFSPKPDPEVILRAIKDAHRGSCVMFGDRPEDMLAGNAAGVRTVGISQSIFSSNDLEHAGADLTFENFYQALESFDSIVQLATQTN